MGDTWRNWSNETNVYDHSPKSVAALNRQKDTDGFSGEDLQEFGMGKCLC